MSAPLLRLRAFVCLVTGLAATALAAVAASPAIPPAPAAYFNDYANYVPAARARALDARLAQFERDTSNQLVVAIYPRLPDGAALEDFTVRTAQAWRVGQKKTDNGAVLFVFVADRALRIEVGYGLEGSLTDAVAHSIIENELKPRLRAGDQAGALDAAVTAMISSTRGEYLGTGRTVRETSSPSRNPVGYGFVAFFWFGVLFLIMASQFRRGYTYLNQNTRRRSRYDNLPWGGGGGSGGWSGGGGSSGGGSSGGGGFSGGGGSFGGGGASGKW